VHRAALDGSGADEGDLDDQVVEGAGLQPGQGGHLGPALDLEHPDRVGRAEHGVDLGVLVREGGQVQLDALVLGHQFEAVAQSRQHPQAQQVELHQADRCAVVLVPLQDAAVLHAPPLHGADLGHRPVTHDHPPGVDAQVAGEVLDLRSQGQHLGGDVVVDVAVGAPLVLAVDHVAPAVDLLGPGILLAGGVAQGLGHVPHRRAGPVGDDVGHLGGIGPAVALVDVLDGLLAPVALDVDVDVRRAVALR
jgi:hypothetical protein